jgi:hypothetical protein
MARSIILNSEQLPKFNGLEVHRIYSMYENSQYRNGGYEADILYYQVHVKYYDRSVSRTIEKVLKVKVLPEPFQKLLGKQIAHGKRSIFIITMYFRTSHSLYPDDDYCLSIDGWERNATSGCYGYYPTQKSDDYHRVGDDCELASIFKDEILGKSFDVEEIEFYQCGYTMKEGTLDFATKYPYKHTPIQMIDGLVYPDEKLESWRWLHGMPYRRPNDVVESDRTNIRVWDDSLKQHVYLQKITDIEIGDENLVQVTFTYKQHDIYGNEANAYCRIHRYIAEHNHEYIRFNVTKKKGDQWYGKISNPKVKFNEREQCIYPSDLYRITRIVDSITHKYIPYKEQFNKKHKTGDKIKVEIKQYDSSVLPEFRNKKTTNFYTIGKTGLDTAQGQVELEYGDDTMVVEYQWFDEKLTGRQILKINK